MTSLAALFWAGKLALGVPFRRPAGTPAPWPRGRDPRRRASPARRPRAPLLDVSARVKGKSGTFSRKPPSGRQACLSPLSSCGIGKGGGVRPFPPIRSALNGGNAFARRQGRAECRKAGPFQIPDACAGRGGPSARAGSHARLAALSGAETADRVPPPSLSLFMCTDSPPSGSLPCGPCLVPSGAGDACPFGLSRGGPTAFRRGLARISGLSTTR